MVLTTFILPQSATNMVLNTFPNNNYQGGATISGINYGTRFQNRAFVKFDLSSIPYLSSARVVSANLLVYLYNSIAGSPMTTMQIDSVQNAWNSATLTWNNQPPGGAFVATKDLVMADSNQWHSFDVTSTVKDWLDNLLGKNGFRFIKPVPDGNTDRWNISAMAGFKAYIELTFNSTGGPTGECNVAYCNFDDGSRQGWNGGSVTNETPLSTPYCLKVMSPNTGRFNFGPTLDSFRVKFYIHPHNLAIGDNGVIFDAMAGADYAPRFLLFNDGAGCYLTIGSVNPYQQTTIGQVTIGVWNQIMLDFDASPSNLVRVWINNVDYGKYDTIIDTPAFTHNYDSLNLNYIFGTGTGYFLMDNFCIRSPAPLTPSPSPISPALETFPSSVRIGTRSNQRTRRGRGNG